MEIECTNPTGRRKKTKGVGQWEKERETCMEKVL